MNKKELIDSISEKLQTDKKGVQDVLDAMEATILDELKENRQVNLTGFGIFFTKVRKARAGVNPRNPGEKIEIPAVRVPKFRPGKTLKEVVRQG